MSLTAAEWHALASAIAERHEHLVARAQGGEQTGREQAALARATRKVHAQLVTARSWGAAS